MPDTDKMIRIIGWIATATAVAMYLSYIDQIRLNLAGAKSSILQPAVACINCSLWTAYGLLRPRKDWPIVFANAPGILLGGITAITGF